MMRERSPHVRSLLVGAEWEHRLRCGGAVMRVDQTIAATTDVANDHQPFDGSTWTAVSDAQHDKRALLAFC